MQHESRTILHIDINHCYAQIEEMLTPPLRDIPMAVGGDESQRHGIILAKNMKAKPFKIITGEPIRNALKKCPDLHIVQSDMKKYAYYTSKVKEIYHEYSDRVEDFGLDEAWVDVTDSLRIYGSGIQIAQKIQSRVKHEYGLTVSIGISFNKVFAKLGSDYKKPSGLTEITKENFKTFVWRLPVSYLLMVGHATTKKLHSLQIYTIGDLACASTTLLKQKFGKMGLLIWSYANGMETSEVTLETFTVPPKSIGNSWTTPKDITNADEAKIVLERLSNSVACRLREKGFMGKVITLSVRDINLHRFTHQRKISIAIDTCSEILQIIMELLGESYDFTLPIRSIGVHVSQLTKTNTYYQLSFFEDTVAKAKNRKIEIVVEDIRKKYGFYSVNSASSLVDKDFSSVNPKGNHTIHPVGFLKGNS